MTGCLQSIVLMLERVILVISQFKWKVITKKGLKKFTGQDFTAREIFATNVHDAKWFCFETTISNMSPNLLNREDRVPSASMGLADTCLEHDI